MAGFAPTVEPETGIGWHVVDIIGRMAVDVFEDAECTIGGELAIAAMKVLPGGVILASHDLSRQVPVPLFHIVAGNGPQRAIKPWGKVAIDHVAIAPDRLRGEVVAGCVVG